MHKCMQAYVHLHAYTLKDQAACQSDIKRTSSKSKLIDLPFCPNWALAPDDAQQESLLTQLHPTPHVIWPTANKPSKRTKNWEANMYVHVSLHSNDDDTLCFYLESCTFCSNWALAPDDAQQESLLTRLHPMPHVIWPTSNKPSRRTGRQTCMYMYLYTPTMMIPCVFISNHAHCDVWFRIPGYQSSKARRQTKSSQGRVAGLLVECFTKKAGLLKTKKKTKAFHHGMQCFIN
jgi:hypothetical protein